MRCVTTGLGGVHRGGERSMDVSADLTELGRTPVAVVCAGAKTVLDIPRTLEVLETQVLPLSPHGCAEWQGLSGPRCLPSSPSLRKPPLPQHLQNIVAVRVSFVKGTTCERGDVLRCAWSLRVFFMCMWPSSASRCTGIAL